MKAPPIPNRRLQGSEFEALACEYLLQKGYRLLARNQNYRSGEIDLIFEEDRLGLTELVFVEVRKRAASGFIRAEESITPVKARRLKSAVVRYLQRYRGNAKTMRIDLIAFQDETLRHFVSFIA